MKSLAQHYQTRSLDYGVSKIREEKILNTVDSDLKDKSVLDIGCSTGYLGRHFILKGAKVIGIDISKQSVKEAKKVLTQAKLVDLNGGVLPFKDNSFDIILASELIEHLFQPVIILKECSRVLKSRGKLIISTPNFLYWGNRLSFLKGDFAYQKSGIFDEGHIHFYTYKTLINDLNNAGYTIVKENHVFAGNNILNKIRRMFPGVFAYQFVISCEKSAI